MLHPIFAHMKLDELKIISAGTNTVVFTDDHYAMKIGLIAPNTPKLMQYASDHGFSVPVIASAQRIIIPKFIQRMIETDAIHAYACILSDVYLASWIVGGFADVMIVALAEPWLKHNKRYTPSSIRRAYEIARKIKINYESLTNGKWMDDHPYNLAYYRGKLVIIDF